MKEHVEDLISRLILVLIISTTVGFVGMVIEFAWLDAWPARTALGLLDVKEIDWTTKMSMDCWYWATARLTLIGYIVAFGIMFALASIYCYLSN